MVWLKIRFGFSNQLQPTRQWLTRRRLARQRPTQRPQRQPTVGTRAGASNDERAETNGSAGSCRPVIGTSRNNCRREKITGPIEAPACRPLPSRSNPQHVGCSCWQTISTPNLSGWQRARSQIETRMPHRCSTRIRAIAGWKSLALARG